MPAIYILNFRLTMYTVRCVSFILLLLCVSTSADYKCLCNYNVEEAVYSSTNTSLVAIGYMYEFDCKPLDLTTAPPDGFFVIQYQKQVCCYAMGAQLSKCVTVLNTLSLFQLIFSKWLLYHHLLIHFYFVFTAELFILSWTSLCFCLCEVGFIKIKTSFNDQLSCRISKTYICTF